MQQATEQQITEWMQNGNPEWGGMIPVELSLAMLPNGRHLATFTLRKLLRKTWVTVSREYQVTK